MNPRFRPLRFALVYSAFGAAWILVTDWLATGSSGPFPLGLQTMKGLLYVVLTGVLAFGLVRVLTRGMNRERTWYREMFEKNPEPMWVYDRDSLRFLAVNDAAVRHFEYPRDEFLRMSLEDLCLPEDIPALRRHVDDASEGIRTGIWRLLLRDGRIIRAEVSAHGVEFSGRHAQMMLAHDLTSRMETEDSLLSANSYLDTLIACSPLAIVSTDREGRVLSWSESAERMFGWSEAEVAGKIPPFVPEDRQAEFTALCARVLDGETLTGLEIRRVRRDGGTIYLRLSAALLSGADGVGSGILAMLEDITQSRLSAMLLESTEQRLRLILNSIGDGIIAVDSEGLILGANPAASRIVGWTEREMVGRDSFTLLHRDPDSECAIRLALREGKPHTGEVRDFLRKDGSSMHVEYFCAPFPLGEGLTGAVLTLRDITERRRAEAALRESEARFRELAEKIDDVFYNVDPHARRVLYISPAYEKVWGRSTESLYADPLSFLEWLHPEDRDMVRAALEAHVRGEPSDIEYRVLHPNGSLRWVRDRSYPVRDAAGTLHRTVGVTRDITDRKLARDALQESTRSLRRITQQLETEKQRLENAQSVAKIGSWEADLATLEPAWSRETFRIFGLDPETHQPRYDDFLERTHPEDRESVDRAFRDSFTAPGSHAITHRIVLPDGTIRHVEETWRVERDGDNVPVRAIGTCQDITARVHLEEQYRHAQKMEAIGQLAGGVAHDFNNMLTVILVRAEQAMRKADAGSPLHKHLVEIHGAAERSAGLTRQLLTYARRQPVSPEVLDANATITRTLGMLRRLIGEGISLSLNPGPGLWPVRLDPVQLDQLLTNLCINARDAIEDVGRIVIETRNVHFDAEYCRLHPDSKPGHYVLLSVSDDGKGMSRDVKEHAFDPFFTTKEVGKGTGLGLATVHGIVQQHGGFIRLYSEPGSGTCFRIYLPRADVPGMDAAAQDAQPPPRARGETVLLVEDEHMLLDVTTEMLHGLGYKVLRANNPLEALEIASRDSGRAHVLLTDMVMPDMNGRVLAERIRALQPHIRCAFMSGYVANVLKGHPGEHAIPYLQKPFSTAELATCLRRALDEDAVALP